MISSLKQLTTLARKSKKMWIIPIILLFIIIVLLVVVAQTSPVPVFLYPIL
jgi:t-SNARE complex subunit (syntaxin)